MKHWLIRSVEDRGWRRLVGFIIGVAILAASIVYARLTVSRADAPIRLRVYALSTLQESLTESLLPAFEQAWEAEKGRDLDIEAVFGSSGTLVGQINRGEPADVAILSNTRHVTELKFGQRVSRKVQPVAIGSTPLVIVTRAGNAAGITGFADLAQSGLRLLHANPETSSAGEWAALAGYGSAFMTSGDPAAAESQAKAIWRNLRLLCPSARATLTLFEMGAGDAFVTYEHAALLARERGVPLEIVVPPATVIAEHVAVIIDGQVTRAEQPVVQAFVDYLLSDAGQEILRRYHVRATDAASGPFAALDGAFTIEDLGGWTKAYTRLVAPLWEAEVETRLSPESGARLLDSTD